MASSVPLYKLVRQEYLPSNVDEGEFDVRVTAAEGHQPGRRSTRWRCRSRRNCSRFPACAWCSPPPGSGFLGGVNGANFFVQLAPHEERTFGWGRLLQWPPWRAFQGNFTQRDIQQEIRQRLQKHSRRARGDPQSADLRRRRRQLRH